MARCQQPKPKRKVTPRNPVHRQRPSEVVLKNLGEALNDLPALLLAGRSRFRPSQLVFLWHLPDDHQIDPAIRCPALCCCVCFYWAIFGVASGRDQRRIEVVVARSAMKLPQSRARWRGPNSI